MAIGNVHNDQELENVEIKTFIPNNDVVRPQIPVPLPSNVAIGKPTKNKKVKNIDQGSITHDAWTETFNITGPLGVTYAEICAIHNSEEKSKKPDTQIKQEIKPSVCDNNSSATKISVNLMDLLSVAKVKEYNRKVGAGAHAANISRKKGAQNAKAKNVKSIKNKDIGLVAADATKAALWNTKKDYLTNNKTAKNISANAYRTVAAVAGQSKANAIAAGPKHPKSNIFKRTEQFGTVNANHVCDAENLRMNFPISFISDDNKFRAAAASMQKSNMIKKFSIGAEYSDYIDTSAGASGDGHKVPMCITMEKPNESANFYRPNANAPYFGMFADRNAFKNSTATPPKFEIDFKFFNTLKKEESSGTESLSVHNRKKTVRVVSLTSDDNFAQQSGAAQGVAASINVGDKPNKKAKSVRIAPDTKDFNQAEKPNIYIKVFTVDQNVVESKQPNKLVEQCAANEGGVCAINVGKSEKPKLQSGAQTTGAGNVNRNMKSKTIKNTDPSTVAANTKNSKQKKTKNGLQEKRSANVAQVSQCKNAAKTPTEANIGGNKNHKKSRKNK